MYHMAVVITEDDKRKIVEEVADMPFFYEPPWPDLFGDETPSDDGLTLVGQREEPLTATIDIDCPTCLGGGEVSAPTPVNYKYDLDTVTCWQCGGKGTIGRREDG